jgi:hypothetical protein
MSRAWRCGAAVALAVFAVALVIWALLGLALMAAELGL